MSKQQQFTLDFTQGELGPTFKGRFDLPIYYRGALRMENVIPQIPGGFSYRGGFYRDSLLPLTGKCRLHPLIISRELSYVVEFGVGIVRFWKRGQLLADGGTPITLSTPYTEAMLPSLWFAQGPDCLVITCQGAPIKKLTYTGGTSFSFGSLAVSGNTGKLPFLPVTDSGDLGNWPAVCCFFNGRLYLANTRNAPSTVWASEPYDYGNFTEFETESVTAKQPRESMHPVSGNTVLGSTAIAGIPYGDLLSDDDGDGVEPDSDDRPIVKVGDRIWGAGITSKDAVDFTGTLTNGSTTISAISSTAIAKLAVGETVSGDGIPKTIITGVGANSITVASPATKSGTTLVFTREAVYSHVTSVGQDSISIDKPATATATAASLFTGWPNPDVAEYEMVTISREIVTDSDAFEMELAGDTNEIINSLGANKELVVQSSTGERIIPNTITANNLSCVRQTAYGAEGIQPFVFGDTMLFVEAGGRAVREYFYRDEGSSYTSPELTFQARHLFEDGIVEMDYSNSPLPTAWWVLKSGELRGCVYSRSNGANAFFRVTTPGGKIEDIAVVPGEEGDELYACVLRGAIRGLERIGDEGHLDAAQAVTVANGAAAVPWLTGAVTAVYQGKAYSLTVAAGSAPVPAAIPNGASILVGLPFMGQVLTMPANVQNQLGVAQMRPKAASQMIARLLESYPFKVGQGLGGKLETANLGTVLPATGDYPVPIQSSWDRDGSVLFQMDSPFDVTVLAVTIEIDAGG